MAEIQLPKDFLLGAATSSYQIEGGWNESGKGLSIWDTFSHTPGKIYNNENGDIACDHYNRYKEDVTIMKELNLKGYRFSISWPRIFPKGRGEVNETGARFYDNLINELVSAGIEPCVTLYHWDLPQALSDEGGWVNRRIINDFVEYARFCFKRYGDRVKKWATFNEAYIVAHLGYEIGRFAPGITDPRKASQVSHHINLAHAMAVASFREIKAAGEIGIVHCMSPVHNMDRTESGAQKARYMDGIWNRWYSDPTLLGIYPEDIMNNKKNQGTAPEIMPGDMDIIKHNRCDFLGINYYFRFRVYDNGPDKPFDWSECVNCKEVPGAKISEMGWEVYPEGLYELVKRIDSDYGKIPLYIMENGIALKDDKYLSDGSIDDDERISYIKSHLESCLKSINDGVNLRGYYYWSLMDNFEWASGYSKKFGLVKIDHKTLERSVKKSGKWYGEFIKGHLKSV